MNSALSSARRIGIGAVTVAVLTLTGCAAGQHAQTADVVPAIDGATANVGPIALRGVIVTAPTDKSYPAGGDAGLQLIMVNDGSSDDELVSVSTSEAREVRFFSSQPDTGSTSASESASGSESASESPTTSKSPTTSESTSEQASPTDSGSAATSSAPVGTIKSINLPMGRATSIGFAFDLPQIQLHGLTSQLFPAQAIPITFQFAHAGAVSFTITVQLASAPSNVPSENISPTAEG